MHDDKNATTYTQRILMVGISIGLSILFCTQNIYAGRAITIPITLFDANNQIKNIGTIVAKNVRCGVLFTPHLSDLPPGVHGFHIHEKPSCEDKGMAAGSHLDPRHTEKHKGPYQYQGHLGDLPILVVDQTGRATLPTLAPHLTLTKIKGHALIIHAGQDNYSDEPEKLGGGGARIACGIISSSH